MARAENGKGTTKHKKTRAGQSTGRTQQVQGTGGQEHGRARTEQVTGRPRPRVLAGLGQATGRKEHEEVKVKSRVAQGADTTL